MRNYILVFFGCLLFHLAGTWSLPLIDRDEPRFAEAAREMRERADFIVPYFNNQFRFDKPPLTYWFQVASYRVFGENDFAARFPTAIAAALVAVILLAWGQQLGGEKVGWWAAIIFSLSLQTFIHGKAAVADMWLVLFVTVAHWAAWELFKANTEHRTSNIEHRTVFWWIFYISLAFAFLAKGPIGWTPLLTVAIAHRFHRQKHFAAHFKFVRGLLLMLVLICLWGIPALVRTQGEFFRVGIGKHVVERSVATMEGHGDVSGVAALLFFDCLRQFFSLVDQTTGALEKTAGAARPHRPIPISRRAYHLWNFHRGADQAAPLHLTGLSVAGAVGCAPFRVFKVCARAPDRGNRGLSRNRAFPQPVPRKIFSNLQSCP
ncbi:MAG: hypothetical protein DME27_08905 [Verrucomicrobia bacterium]|nr:MAG: hypothetical protein DME27_08905 [Verrucomicrobiota bacterium]